MCSFLQKRIRAGKYGRGSRRVNRRRALRLGFTWQFQRGLYTSGFPMNGGYSPWPPWVLLVVGARVRSTHVEFERRPTRATASIAHDNPYADLTAFARGREGRRDATF